MGRRLGRHLMRFLAAIGILAAVASVTAWADPDPRARIQADLGIRIVEAEATFTDAELSLIDQELASGPVSRFGPLRSVQVLEKRHNRGGSNAANYGSFSAAQGRIRITDGAVNFKMALLHEVFHALAEEKPELFQAFLLTSGWTIGSRDGLTLYSFLGTDPRTGEEVHLDLSDFDIAQNPEEACSRLDLPIFPSEYSKLGPMEMFAETGAAAVFAVEGDGSSPYRLREFESTPLFDWWRSTLAAGGVSR